MLFSVWSNNHQTVSTVTMEINEKATTRTPNLKGIERPLKRLQTRPPGLGTTPTLWATAPDIPWAQKWPTLEFKTNRTGAPTWENGDTVTQLQQHWKNGKMEKPLTGTKLWAGSNPNIGYIYPLQPQNPNPHSRRTKANRTQEPTALYRYNEVYGKLITQTPDFTDILRPSKHFQNGPSGLGTYGKPLPQTPPGHRKGLHPKSKSTWYNRSPPLPMHHTSQWEREREKASHLTST